MFFSPWPSLEIHFTRKTVFTFAHVLARFCKANTTVSLFFVSSWRGYEWDGIVEHCCVRGNRICIYIYVYHAVLSYNANTHKTSREYMCPPVVIYFVARTLNYSLRSIFCRNRSWWWYSLWSPVWCPFTSWPIGRREWRRSEKFGKDWNGWPCSSGFLCVSLWPTLRPPRTPCGYVVFSIFFFFVSHRHI